MRAFGGFVKRCAIAAVTVTAVLGTCTAAVAASAGTGSSADGTVAAKSGGQERLAVKAPSRSTTAPPDASGDLSTVVATVGHGGYTAAGTAMRNLGYGTISITGVPKGATVASATLLWDVLGDSASPAFAAGTFGGRAITGTEWASGASPCWPVSANFSYEANVTSLVDGNGSYQLAGFASGQSDGADPWNSGSTPPLLEGASLVVIYRDASMPESTIQIAEGASETDQGASATATLDGFTVSAAPAVKTTYVVADGQAAGNTATFDGTTLPGVGFPGDDPQAAAHYSQGNLWDTVTTDVSADVTPGDTSANMAVTGYGDCLVWVGQVLDVSSGPVLGLGDSVAAGYGLASGEGYGTDSPSAYPVLLAQKIGVPVRDYAVEGACTVDNLAVGCDKKSVADQLAEVEKDTSFTPSLITLDVGANDINFSGCIQYIFGNSDYTAANPADPCYGPTLQAKLAALQANLHSDLSRITAAYPHATVLVMDYYNPFPGPAQAACTLFDGLNLVSWYHKYGSWLTVLQNYFGDTAQFNAQVSANQSTTAATAQGIIDGLNGAINAAAAGLATVITTGDFAGHDICQLSPQWLFSPKLLVELSWHGHSATFPLTGGQYCQYPNANELALDQKLKYTFVDTPVGASASIIPTVNCMPHPTVAGQQAIANDFYQQSGTP